MRELHKLKTKRLEMSTQGRFRWPNLGESLIFALLLKGASIYLCPSAFQLFNIVLSQTQLQAMLGSESTRCVFLLQWMSKWISGYVHHMLTEESVQGQAPASVSTATSFLWVQANYLAKPNVSGGRKADSIHN